MLFWKHLYEIRNYKQSCINISTLNSQILFSKYKSLKTTSLSHTGFKKALERTWLACKAPWRGFKKEKFWVRWSNCLSYGFYCCDKKSHSVFQASHGYEVRLCLKKKKRFVSCYISSANLNSKHFKLLASSKCPIGFSSKVFSYFLLCQ